MSSPNDRPQPEIARQGNRIPSADHAASTHRAKEGAAGSFPGTCRDITVLFLRSQIEQLDNLAVDIRAASGRWITRSGIVTAIIEAAIRGGNGA